MKKGDDFWSIISMGCIIMMIVFICLIMLIVIKLMPMFAIGAVILACLTVIFDYTTTIVKNIYNRKKPETLERIESLKRKLNLFGEK